MLPRLALFSPFLFVLQGWPGCAEEGISSALRLVFCWGAAEALATAASPYSGEGCEHGARPVDQVWEAHESCSELLAAAGAAAHASLAAGESRLMRWLGRFNIG